MEGPSIVLESAVWRTLEVCLLHISSWVPGPGAAEQLAAKKWSYSGLFVVCCLIASVNGIASVGCATGLCTQFWLTQLIGMYCCVHYICLAISPTCRSYVMKAPAPAAIIVDADY